MELFDELDLQTARSRRGKIGIVSDHAHAERDRAAAELAPDPAHSDDAECFVVKLDAFKIFPTPFLAAQTRVRLRNFSRDAKQKRKRVFGGRDSVATGRVQDKNAPPSRRFNIDIVHSHARATDHP